ncbi:hypothetical protein FH972_013075 [Carpinus fangiana]|nr:hypothetical protein FH972_013075 [Carpinus fangiana]
MDSRGVETLQTAQSKPIRNFDLEKLPEEYMDESENHIGPNNSKMLDGNSFLVKRTSNTDEDSSVGANLSVIQVDSPSLKQTYPETNLRVLSVNGQEIIQKFFQECTIENKTSQDFQRIYLPAVGKSAYQDARHIEKQTLLHQGSLNFMTPTCNPVNSGPEKVPEQANDLIVEGLFPKNPAICSQGSSTLPYSKGLLNQRPLSLKSISVSGNQDLNSFPLTSQTSTDSEDENPNDSDNGSNSIQSQYTKSCKDKDISIGLKDTPGLGDACCEAVQASKGGEETVQSECEEAPHVIKDGFDPLLSSTLSGSETKQIDHSMCTNSKSTTVASSEKPDIVREGNEQYLKDKSAVCETCENIAAEILLSMAPCTSQVDHQLPGTQTKAELLNFSNDNKWNPCQRSHANNFQGGGGASESIKWPKTVNRRSTRRRPR